MLPPLREIKKTADGSVTIYLPQWEESYHSKHGAIQEANHVFIEKGLHFIDKNRLSILEIGFGTGLNALLTLIRSTKNQLDVHYTGVEAYPINADEIQCLNYVDILEDLAFKTLFEKMHQTEWETCQTINSNFKLTKTQLLFQDIQAENAYDLIYFDAFGYRVQPDLWSEEIFKILFRALKKHGVLVTYACRNPIKRAMENAGFKTEKIPGPPGKREMLRAIKK